MGYFDCKPPEMGPESLFDPDLFDRLLRDATDANGVVSYWDPNDQTWALLRPHTHDQMVNLYSMGVRTWEVLADVDDDTRKELGAVL